MTPGTGVLAPGGQITADSEEQVMTMRFFGTPSARTFSPPSLNFSLFSAIAFVGKGPATTFFDFTSKTRHSLPPPSWIDDCWPARRS